MEYKINPIKFTVILIFAAGLFNINVAQNFKSIEGKTTVKLNGFSVKSPSGDDWEFDISNDKNIAHFADDSFNFLTGESNSTFITVYRDTFLIITEKTEKEDAANYLNAELKIIKKHTKTSSEDVKIDTVSMFDTTIAGKKYYAMAYSTTNKISFLNEYYTDNLLFIHFPENYKTTGLFYGFLISCAYNQPLIFDINSSDLTPIYKMIKNWQIDVK
jgi:hypothetical protein